MVLICSKISTDYFPPIPICLFKAVFFSCFFLNEFTTFLAVRLPFRVTPIFFALTTLVCQRLQSEYPESCSHGEAGGGFNNNYWVCVCESQFGLGPLCIMKKIKGLTPWRPRRGQWGCVVASPTDMDASDTKVNVFIKHLYGCLRDLGVYCVA